MMTGTRNLSHFVRHLDGGVARMEFEVDGFLRAGCTQAIEGGLAAIPDITLAQVSVADRRVSIEWRDGKVDPVRFIDRLSELGYEAHPCNRPPADATPASSTLPYCLGAAALAAFATTLLSAIAGSWPDVAADMTSLRHDLFHWLLHWLPAAIAVPAAVWAGRPFFVSTIRAATAGRLDREAPMSAALMLAFGLSVWGTLHGASPSSFDSGLMLLAVALAVRTLEMTVQRDVPAFTGNLAPPASGTVTKFASETELAEVPVGAARSGDLVLVRPGERIAVDGVVTEGRSEIDQSSVTGETLPASVARDSVVYAGTRNVSGALRVRVDAGPGAPSAGAACLSERTAAAAGHPRLSDRAMRLYPALALAAGFATFAGRTAFGADGHDAVTAAVAVLVLTYPAGFGLAVSAVDAWAAGALSRAGVLLKSGDGLERLGRVDTILFDKTGTLTMPDPEVVNTADVPPERLALAGRLALSSRHPLAAAVVRAAGATAPIYAIEEPGQGIRCVFRGVPLRLGRPSFCDAERRAAAILETDPEASVIAFAYGTERHVLAVRQQLRSDAIETMAQLRHDGFAVEIVSGDRATAVGHAAGTLGVDRWHAGMTPADKIGRVCVLQAQGHTVLMVGDGLNDAPSLAAADVALSVGTAGPSALAAADAVVAGDRLAPVAVALAIARRARRLRRQSLWFAAACTAVAAPAAVAGMAIPLVAALAMGGTAVVVALNALRAGYRTPAFAPRDAG